MDKYMKFALIEAERAYSADEIPVGCVIVKNDVVISKAHNMKEKSNDATSHAEIIAIKKACGKLKRWRLDDCELYVTLEPCMMCVGAILESRIKKVYYGTKNNSEQMYKMSHVSKYCEFIMIPTKQCSKILTDFFEKKRKS